MVEAPPELQRAMGRFAFLWSGLEFELERIIWALRQQDPFTGSRKTHRRLAKMKRDDIRSLLPKADAAPRAMIERALPYAERATKVRNLLFHSLVFFDHIGHRVVLVRTENIRPPDIIDPEYLDLASISAATHAAERAYGMLSAALKELQRPGDG